MLSSSARGHVLRVHRDPAPPGTPEPWVLRLSAGAQAADALLARLAARQRLPGLALPRAWGHTDEGLWWTARPFVAGRAFDRALREAPPADAAGWVVELLETLATLHESGLLHRDLKADNLLLGPDGPLLLDLDLLGEDASAAAGSPDHLAPELLLGQPSSPASDLFALGATLAYAWCGPPAPAFRRDFPARPFWAAAGLDPGRISEALRDLVRALVRRHPADRPASARDAARRLDAARHVPPEREPAFAMGRARSLARLLDELRAPPRVRREVVLLTLEDPEEAAELLRLVELHLALHDRPARGVALTPPVGASLAEALDTPGEALLDGVELARAEGVDALRDVVRGFCDEPDAPAARWWLALDAARADALVAEAEHCEPGVTVRRLHWPAPGADELAAHLDALSDGTAPELARSLGASLHALTDGRRAALREALRRAPEQGVMRAEEGRWTLLVDRWPAPEQPSERLDAAWRAVDAPDARRALACLAAWGRPLRTARLAQLADADAEPLADALRSLRDAGLLRPDLRLHAGVAWRPDLEAPVLALAGDALAAEAHARCLAALADEPDTLERRARHALAAARDATALDAAFALAERLLHASRLAAARRALQRLRAHPLAVGPAWEARLTLFEARVEFAQARAGRALELLEAADLLGADAEPEAALTGARAAEYAGRRDLARALNERVLAHAGATPAQRLHARAGLAYGALLSGDADACLAHADVPVPDDADPEAATKLLDVRGLALTRLGRFDEAEVAYDRSRAHAERADSPLPLAQTELNRAQLDRRRSRLGAGIAALERSAEAYARAGLVRGRARALHNLGVLLADRGELARARSELGSARTLRRRAGDEHGAALSLAALGMVHVEAGEWGAARESLAAAREALEAGGYERELQLLGVYEDMLGSACDAAPHHRAELPELPDHPGLGLRARAFCLGLAGQHEGALLDARRALAAARAAHEAAETWRAAWLVIALAPRDADAAEALTEAAAALGGPVRAAELRWRLQRPRAARELAALLDVFEAAGQQERVWACAEELRRACEREGDDAGRRRAAARVKQAAEALVDGLPTDTHDRLLARLARLQPEAANLAEEDPMQVQWLLACNRRMAVEDDLEGLLLSIVDMALEVSGAHRGLLVLLADGETDVQVARNMDHEDVGDDELQFSRTVVREAVRAARPVATTDAAADARFAGVASLQSLRSRAVLCVPLPGAQNLQGALYLDDETRRVPFDDTDVARVEALADQAQLAILNLRRRAEIERLNARLSDRVQAQEQELTRARSALRKRGAVAPVGGLVGESEAMQKLYALVQRVGPTQLSVLVTGPSGAGKDLVARALHEHSPRAAGPLIIENVAAVPANLLESELFGHVRGAFTGADRDRRGLLAEASGGTFVLDEIGELPMDLQPKLLRALETGEVRPVGGRSPVKVDVRFVAATNRDLLERVRQGEFREDLYYRLNAMEIRVPPLGERLSDIPLLARHFLARLNEEHGSAKEFDESVLRALVQRTWPGEVRELSNEVSRLYFLSESVIDDPALVREPARSHGVDARPSSLRLEDVERETILRALQATDGRKDRAAKLLGISRAGLYTKLKRLDIDATQPRD